MPSQDLYILENDKLIKLKGRKDYVSSISSASEVIWLKFTPDYFKVTKAYILNTKTGAEVAQDPNYIKMKCGKNSSNGCKAIDKDAYVLMNYTKNIETTKIYGTMYLDNKILLSKYSVNSNSSEGYIRSRNISWNTGILAEIDDVFLYIP